MPHAPINQTVAPIRKLSYLTNFNLAASRAVSEDGDIANTQVHEQLSQGFYHAETT